jgi:hypothetical protein
MTRVALVVLAGVIAGAACAEGDGRQGAPPPDPAQDAREEADLRGCALVTKEEVAAALGSAVNDGEEEGLAGCAWKAPSGPRISLAVFAGHLLSPGTCDGQKFLVSGRKEEIPGLGDSTLWGSSGDLVVCSAKAVLRIDVKHTRHSSEQDRETALQVARAALRRL